MKIALDNTEKKHVFLSFLLKMLSCKKRYMREGGSVMSFVNIRLNFENKSTLAGCNRVINSWHQRFNHSGSILLNS